MNFDKEESKFEKKNVCVCCVCVWRGGGSALTPKLYAKLCQLKLNTEIQLSTQYFSNSIFSIIFFSYPNFFYFNLFFF